MTFQNSPTASLWAKDASTGEFTSIYGITRDTTTPENAAAQVNKVLAIVGKQITTDGMVRIKTEEATDNG